MKFFVIGIAHCGTCSLERYLVEQGHEVVRSEEYFLEGYNSVAMQRNHPDLTQYIPIMIICAKWSEGDLKQFYAKWNNTDLICVDLDEMAKNKNFPHENQGNHLSEIGVRPKYTSKNTNIVFT